MNDYINEHINDKNRYTLLKQYKRDGKIDKYENRDTKKSFVLMLYINELNKHINTKMKELKKDNNIDISTTGI